jgi:hypothetical protein
LFFRGAESRRPQRFGFVFRVQPPRAGGIAPKCWLCFFKLAESRRPQGFGFVFSGPTTTRRWYCANERTAACGAARDRNERTAACGAARDRNERTAACGVVRDRKKLALFFQVRSIAGRPPHTGVVFSGSTASRQYCAPRKWHCLFRLAIPEQPAAEPQGLALFILALILPLY